MNLADRSPVPGNMSRVTSSSHATTVNMRDPQTTRARFSHHTFFPFFHHYHHHQQVVPSHHINHHQLPSHHNTNTLGEVIQAQPHPHSTHHLHHPLNTTVADFQPQHQQPTTPFWHQFTPGLHYSPDTAIIHDNMDTHTVIIGHGTKYNSHKNARTTTHHHERKPHQGEMVEVYNNTCFITSVPLKVLVRFSAAASEKWPKPNRPATVTITAAESPAKSSKSTTSDGSGAVAGDSNTSKLDPARPTHPNPSPPPKARTPGVASGKKRLTLLMPSGAENPSNETVQWTLQWMLDNAHSTTSLIPYAPNPDSLPFPSLIDFYQTALVLDLRPIPRHITAALMKRLSDTPPSVEMFRDLSLYIPKGNVVIDRAINSFHEHGTAGRYSREEMGEFETWMREEGNEAFQERKEHIFGILAKKKMVAEQRAAAAAAVMAASRKEGRRGRGMSSVSSRNWRQQDGSAALPSPPATPRRRDWKQEGGSAGRKGRGQRKDSVVGDSAKSGDAENGDGAKAAKDVFAV